MDGQILEWGVWSNYQHDLRQLEDALDRAEAALGLPIPSAPLRVSGGFARPLDSVILPGVPGGVFSRSLNGTPMTASAQAGLAPREWVEFLSPDEMNALARKIARDPAMRRFADSERVIWLRVLFGFVALEVMGATEAYGEAQAWSKTAPGHYGSDAEFDRDWKSFDPIRPDGISVGTLIYHAEAAGVDLTPLRDLAWARSTASGLAPYAQHVFSGGGSGAAHLLRNPFSQAPPPFFSPIQFDPRHLHPVSWLVLNLLIKGQVSVLVGQGAGAKTALAVHLAVSLAADRQQIGPIWVKSYPKGLKVAFISAEEGSNELGLLVAAACDLLHLTPAERARVAANLEIHDAQKSGWMLGKPRRPDRDRIVAENEDEALQELAATLSGFDLLILDNLAGLFFLTDENNNHSITLLMERLTRAARQADCAVLLLHHTPKMTREAATAQRGEASLSRGGSTITTRARVVLTLTAPTTSEAAGFVVQGYQADRVRRLEHGKVNDVPPMDPLYLVTTSVDVEVFDGSKHPVRAVEFIQPPANGGITNAVRNVVMNAVDTGAKDAQGAREPLTRSGNTKRAAAPAIGRALRAANSALSEVQAEALGRAVLEDLIRAGCVEVTDVPVRQYRPDGRPNGVQKRRGLVTRWDLVPWPRGDATPLRPTDAPQDHPENSADPAPQTTASLGEQQPVSSCGARETVPSVRDEETNVTHEEYPVLDPVEAAKAVEN